MMEPRTGPQCQDTPDWRLPLNISGLRPESMARIIEDDLGDLLFEYASEPAFPGFQSNRMSGPLNFGPLHAIAERRITDLGIFFRDIASIIDVLNSDDARDHIVDLTALSGDPHHRGRRPIKLKTGSKDMVLKFSDPRPYQLIRQVLCDLSGALSLNLSPPDVVGSSDNQWYLIPFLEPDLGAHPDPDGFIKNMGALTAVSFALRMIDLHYENIIVSGGQPIIIDPECTPYPFGFEGVKQRLYDTRLLHLKPHTSGLRGGQFTKDERPGGLHASLGFRGRKPAPSLNRIRDVRGKLIDPVNHRKAFFSGYRAAYDWCARNADTIVDQLRHFLVDDYRIRYLYRNTVQYLSTIDVMNVPMTGDYAEWRDVVFNRFRHAPHFGETMTLKALAAEREDMDRRDVPYFWVNAGERVVRHASGVVQSLDITSTPRDLAIRSVLDLSSTNLEEQISVIDGFFDLPIES